MKQDFAVQWAALLGRRDEPTDGVRDYCRWLGRALEQHGIELIEVEVPWAQQGWRRALAGLRKRTGGWRGRWILVQYTALGWSRRGFPIGLLATLALLRRRGARIAIVFHSPEPQPGSRPVDRLRRACQRWVMRRASRQAAKIVLPLPLERIHWLGEARGKATFIPIGANIPATVDGLARGKDESPATVAVFGVTGAPHTAREVEEIAWAARRAKERLPRVRLLVFGRGSAEARPLLERVLADTGIELEVRGILPAEEVAGALAAADAFIFVRGELAANRGSAIAAIACALPIVGYGAPDVSFPLNCAGTRLVPHGDPKLLGETLAEVLTDPGLRCTLRARSRQALADYFCWERIAERYLEALGRD